ncbi:TIR domain-containing protein [Sorangium sp. So ce131]|uniref:TIR domain-containing protein n=1 Tax=Sorangium sp. So ce131 TaxID=3133282 RepID=UPI003F6196B7
MPVDLYVSYAPEDGELFRELSRHLAGLERQGHVRITSSSSVEAGDSVAHALEEKRAAAQVVLLLLSADFFASARCRTEMDHALSLQAAQGIHVVPVLLRSCAHDLEPVAQLTMLPEPSKPVTRFQDHDDAWELVTRAVRGTIAQIQGGDPSVSRTRQGIHGFEYGTPVPPERFAGRRAQIADVRARIGGISAQSISIVGLHRSGKSSLLRYIKERIQEFCTPAQSPVVVLLDLQARQLHTPAGILDGLRRGIASQTGRAPWQSEQNGDGFAVDDGLAELRDRGVRLLVLIDELECIGSRLDRFQDWGEDFRAKATAGYFALVLTTRRPLAEVYAHCGLTSPFGNIFSVATLGALPEPEWEPLVRSGFARGDTVPSTADMALIDELAGGFPYYVQMAGALLWQHRDHQATRDAFRVQTADRFRELWSNLTPAEQSAVRCASGAKGYVASTSAVDDLKRLGLLRPGGGVFSSAFAAFVREQR